jgi:hypothetical protein
MKNSCQAGLNNQYMIFSNTAGKVKEKDKKEVLFSRIRNKI